MSVTTTDKNTTAEVGSWIERHLTASSLVTDLRKEGLASFQKLGLPVGKAEEYKFTPVTRMLEKNFNFSAANAEAQDINLEEVLIPGLDANVIVFVNGVFSKKHSNLVSSEIRILTLKEAIDQRNELALQHLAKHADFKQDALSSLERGVMAGWCIHRCSQK